MSLKDLLNCFDEVKFHTDTDALKALEENFNCAHGVIKRKNKDYEITNVEHSAISYLINEFDYDFDMYDIPPYPEYKQFELPATLAISGCSKCDSYALTTDYDEINSFSVDDFYITLFIGFVAGVSFTFIAVSLALVVGHLFYGVV